MNQYFDYTDIVSNGFITSINYYQTNVNQYLEDLQYLNIHQIAGRPACIPIDDFIKLIVNSGLTPAEQATIKTDVEDDQVFVFTTMVSVAEKLDSVVNLLMNGMYYENMVDAQLDQLNCYQQAEVDQIISNPFDIYYQNERIGQLEWVEYAKYCYSNHQLIESINSFNRYFLETNNPEAGFNVGVILSQINLDHQAIDFYCQAINLGYNCHHNIALSYFKLAKYNLALEHLEQVDFEQSHKSHLLKAQVLIKQGDYQHAVAVLNNGYIQLKKVNQVEAQRIKKVFLSLNQHINQVQNIDK